MSQKSFRWPVLFLKIWEPGNKKKIKRKIRKIWGNQCYIKNSFKNSLKNPVLPSELNKFFRALLLILPEASKKQSSKNPCLVIGIGRAAELANFKWLLSECINSQLQICFASSLTKATAKRATWWSHFLDFPFICIQTGDMVKWHPFLSPHCHFPFLLLLNVFGMIDNHSASIIVCLWLVS